MKVLNFGSLNIDYVYRVPHLVQHGETLASHSLKIVAGGKGANQSVALARAGVKVFHAGKVGKEGSWLITKLAEAGVNTKWLKEGKESNGHAIIQVDDQGENAIILFAGANFQITEEEIDQVLEHFEKGDFLLLQNEINLIPSIIEKAHNKGLKICCNPAPMAPEVKNYPLHWIDILFVNEIEGAALVGGGSSEEILKKLSHRYPRAEIILTLGADGVLYQFQKTHYHVPIYPVRVVDTTAAGDTFTGYFLAYYLEGKSTQQALEFASKAAAICVSRSGAQDSIPTRAEVLSDQ
jgi:ribokinase